MNGKVKVIKREDRKQLAKKPAKVQPKNPAREMVSTVTTWVNEFQQRRREETKQAFNELFAAKARPSTI
jgi:hypothetical protein